MSGPPDEFAWIARLRPLTRGDSRALDLADDVAVLPSRPGFDLVISKDAMVEGVHFLVGEAPDLVARRTLRAALSDLAAKGAQPFGYFLMTAWPADRDGAYRDRFIAGLAQDGEQFGVSLLGGDTVATGGPLTLSATVLGWTPAGGVIRRSGARSGDLAMVCGVIGDGWLGLQAARGEITDGDGRLARAYRLPEPLFVLGEALRNHAVAAADVSDGLLADLGHIATASALAVSIDLAELPLSTAAAAWLKAQPDEAIARLALATGGDDYAIVCAVPPDRLARFRRAVFATQVRWSQLGAFSDGAGLTATFHGRILSVDRTGWRH